MMERRNQAREANEWADTYGSLGMAAPMRLTQLPLHILDPWVDAAGKAQPFKPYSQGKLEELAENIRKNGVIEAICVRPLANGRFQIIAGHNRVAASRMAGLTVVPALVRQLDDQQAWKLMIFSNLKHRPFLLPSEKARAYAELIKDLRHQGQRTDLTSDNDCPKLESGWSHQVLAEQHGVSATSIKQHLRLLELQPELLDMMQLIQVIKANTNPRLKILGMLPTFTKHYKDSKEVIEWLHNKFPSLAFQTSIGRYEAAPKSVKVRTPVMLCKKYAKSIIANQYIAAARELTERVEA